MSDANGQSERVERLTKLARRKGLSLLRVSTGWALYDARTDRVTAPPWVPRERAEAMTLDEVERALSELR